MIRSFFSALRQAQDDITKAALKTFGQAEPVEAFRNQVAPFDKLRVTLRKPHY